MPAHNKKCMVGKFKTGKYVLDSWGRGLIKDGSYVALIDSSAQGSAPSTSMFMQPQALVSYIGPGLISQAII